MEGSGDLRVCRRRQQLSENSDAVDRKLDTYRVITPVWLYTVHITMYNPPGSV